MGRIEFWPVCSECGRVLKTDTVTFVQDEHTVDVPDCQNGSSSIDVVSYDLSPSKCPYCGEKFEAVVMAELPFDPGATNKRSYRWSNEKFGRRYRSRNRKHA